MADKTSSKQATKDNDDGKKNRHKRKMTKIMGKIWNFPKAERFHDSKYSSSSSRPLDLKTVGQNLDDNFYQHGRKGWEKLACDIAGVFNTHIASKSKHAVAAKENLDNALKLLEKVDISLVAIASKAKSILDIDKDSNQIGKDSKKRKKNIDDSLMNTHVPKKRVSSIGSITSASTTLTLSQREEQAIKELASYVEECGGDRQQVLSFHVTITHRGSSNRDEITYFSPQGHRYRKKADVVRFLGLSPPSSSNHNSNGSSSRVPTSKISLNTNRPRNSRDCENERKRLKKEIDKLLKAHGKTTKSLDDLRSEHSNDLNPIDDSVLMEEKRDAGEDTSKTIVRVPDMQGFPGIPSYCTGDLIMVWDFLCTFFRVLSLEPISLDDFASALIYDPRKSTTEDGKTQNLFIPVYLAEAHLALLKLLLNDPSSDEWWWSTLESDVTIEDENDAMASDNYNKVSDATSPVIKVDMAELLEITEDPVLTTRWLQALEDVRTRKTNSGGPIKSAIKSALSITSNPLVKTYLQKAMRKWKGNAAGFTKRAVVWLVDRVREARPDLWGKKVSKEVVQEQSFKVAKEVADAMELFEEDADISNENGTNLEEGSEDDDESEEDDDDADNDYIDEDDETTKKKSTTIARRQIRINDEAPVTSPIPVKPPPTIVDLLLPPAKPQFSSDIITPLTWPCVVGASVCRILHRYKRQRNEVDDELRDFHMLPPLSVAERRNREKNAAQRIFSETAAPFSIGTDDDDDACQYPLESAIDHLCSGKPYLNLYPVQKLCLFRALIEASYDTHRVTRAIDENFRARINAVKSLESEEKRAKREAREEAAVADRSARERLSEDARLSFLAKKRRELRSNKYTTEHTNDLTDEEMILKLDDESKEAYDSLPRSESFNKNEVNAMVAKINEEAAFESDSVLVLNMEEIKAREEEHLEKLEDRLSSFGNVDEISHLDRETSAKVEKLKREIDNFKLTLLSLSQSRAEAVEILNDAIEEGTVKELKFAIKTAKIAQLFGTEESTNGVWALDILRDAALELKATERRRRVTEAQKDLVAKRNKCFIRTYALGLDRFRNCVWHFDNDPSERVWTETNLHVMNTTDIDKKEQTDAVTLLDNAVEPIDASLAIIGAKDEEQDFFAPRSSSYSIEEKKDLFSRKEYHPSGIVAGLPKRNWGCHVTEKSLRSLMKNYDQRGIRESALKARIKEVLEAKGQSNLDDTEIKNKSDNGTTHNNEEAHDDINQDDLPRKSSFQSSGDEESFSRAKEYAKAKGHNINEIESMTSAIGHRARVRTVVDDTEGIARYEMGTVIGWSNFVFKTDGNDQENEQKDMIDEYSKSSTWKVAPDHGEEKHLSDLDLIQSLTRAFLWTNKHKDYVEMDGSFLLFRNNLGRFCGRQVDAPYSASPFFFAKQMIKREAELYTQLKNRSHYNEWGGRSVARNTWLMSMKEPNNDFYAVQNGLLTLETAFFELSGKFDAIDENIDNRDNESLPDGKTLLNNESYRFEIELESITGTPRSLWNSRETRAIFLEIMRSSSSLEILALGLDLMCRNCKQYLKANKATAQYTYESNIVTSTRRQNLWQQKQNESYY